MLWPFQRWRAEAMSNLSETRRAQVSFAADALWGATPIAAFLGTSDDFVRKLERDPDAPVRRLGDRLFARRSDLLKWADGQNWRE